VFRDGDYFGSQVNLTHRVVNRALGGEVLVTDTVREAIGEHRDLELDSLGEVDLKGFPEPTPLYLVRVRK
jgi:class 3 adenylate cyclase